MSNEMNLYNDFEILPMNTNLAKSEVQLQKVEVEQVKGQNLNPAGLYFPLLSVVSMLL